MSFGWKGDGGDGWSLCGRVVWFCEGGDRKLIELDINSVSPLWSLKGDDVLHRLLKNQ